MNFNKGKFWILQLGWSDPGSTYKLRGERLQGGSAERDLGVWVDDKPLCTVLAWSHLEYCGAASRASIEEGHQTVRV